MSGARVGKWITQAELRSRIDVVNGCWTWRGRKNNGRGYGRILRHNREWAAHRISYFLFMKDAPLTVLINKKLCVCHSCDNPSCINPEHLFLGSQRDNMQDASRKGRVPHGDKHYRRNSH